MLFRSRTSRVLGIAAVALMLAACRSNRDTRSPDRAQQRAESREWMAGERAYEERVEADPPPWRITAVVIDMSVAEVCGIDAAQTHFAYDTVRLDTNAQAAVAALAECFVDGPLSERSVVVIGHANPGGPDEYNRELGMSRAEAVAEALRSEGLETTRIDVESLGEAEALAHPDEWPDDRRVDIALAE